MKQKATRLSIKKDIKKQKKSTRKYQKKQFGGDDDIMTLHLQNVESQEITKNSLSFVFGEFQDFININNENCKKELKNLYYLERNIFYYKDTLFRNFEKDHTMNTIQVLPYKSVNGQGQTEIIPKKVESIDSKITPLDLRQVFKMIDDNESEESLISKFFRTVTYLFDTKMVDSKTEIILLKKSGTMLGKSHERNFRIVEEYGKNKAFMEYYIKYYDNSGNVMGSINIGEITSVIISFADEKSLVEKKWIIRLK